MKMAMTGKYSERRETRNWIWNEWTMWARKKNINEVMKERETYLNGKRKGMQRRRGVYEWGKRTNSPWMEPTDKPHLARCIVFTYPASSYLGRLWPQAQSRLSIPQLRKNVLCKCERLSPAHLTSGFKLFCHVGTSLVTQTYVRIAKYISSNWMLVHYFSCQNTFLH